MDKKARNYWDVEVESTAIGAEVVDLFERWIVTMINMHIPHSVVNQWLFQVLHTLSNAIFNSFLTTPQLCDPAVALQIKVCLPVRCLFSFFGVSLFVFTVRSTYRSWRTGAVVTPLSCISGGVSKVFRFLRPFSHFSVLSPSVGLCVCAVATSLTFLLFKCNCNRSWT